MSENIYVGNLKYNTSEEKLKSIFSEFGDVSEVRIIRDQETGHSKGYAFIKISGGAKKAIEKLDKTQLGGRTIRVSPGKDDKTQ